MYVNTRVELAQRRVMGVGVERGVMVGGGGGGRVRNDEEGEGRRRKQREQRMKKDVTTSACLFLERISTGLSHF